MITKIINNNFFKNIMRSRNFGISVDHRFYFMFNYDMKLSNFNLVFAFYFINLMIVTKCMVTFFNDVKEFNDM